MVRAIIRGESLSLDQAEWKGATPGLLEKLEAATEGAIQGVAGSDPAPELTVAETAAAELGGRIVSYTPETDTVVGRIY